ncbi:KOM, putative [Ricinus communis]|uniref:RHOMBOID-like protein n=1 Tax=Ricinus communis TaxID=3988 RepID=B9T6X8_RICCO|nr:KOM, putative [Ricinus communis]
MINFPVKIGLLYVISGFGGSLMSSLFIQTNISVGASGALFGLLGAMLSELITNWTIYTNKVAAFVTLLIIIAINLAVGILPHVDNFAHIGGFLSGFLLGFVFLIRPQFGWVSQRYVPPGYSPASVKPKFKAYQRILWIISLIVVVAGLTLGLVLLLRGVDANDHCSWCHYLSCVPTSRWSCNTEPASCLSSQMGSQLNVTCTTNGKSSVYRLPDATNSQIEGLCTQLCR